MWFRVGVWAVGVQVQVQERGIDRDELERRENELKERALRNKVVRTRKSSTGANLPAATASSSSSS